MKLGLSTDHSHGINVRPFKCVGFKEYYPGSWQFKSKTEEENHYKFEYALTNEFQNPELSYIIKLLVCIPITLNKETKVITSKYAEYFANLVGGPE